MVGTIALYNSEGKRLHTVYLGESPEAGKGKFYKRFLSKIQRMVAKFPSALVIGIADGAKDNWSFLNQFTQNHCLDFFHASEYVAKVASAAFQDSPKREEWLTSRLHELKHTPDYQEKMITEMKQMQVDLKISSSGKEVIRVAQTYFENNKERMNYAYNVLHHLPIGSGIVEAGCKVLVKERLCCSGMRWSSSGCRDILQLRALALTDGRWEQFWKKVDQFGFDLAA
jgi:hypothetical protein